MKEIPSSDAVKYSVAIEGHRKGSISAMNTPLVPNSRGIFETEAIGHAAGRQREHGGKRCI